MLGLPGSLTLLLARVSGWVCPGMSRNPPLEGGDGFHQCCGDDALLSHSHKEQ